MTIRTGSLLFLVFLLLIQTWGCGEKPTEQELRAQAQAFEEEGKFEDAIGTYQKLLSLYPKSQQADTTVQKIAYLYYNNLKDFEKAIEYHRKLIDAYPESPLVSKARFMIGYIYANDLHDYDSAEAAYQDFLKHHPNDELVESVKWELEHLGQDINEQLKELFGEKSNGGATAK